MFHIEASPTPRSFGTYLANSYYFIHIRKRRGEETLKAHLPLVL